MPWNLFGCDQAAVLRRFALAGYSPAADDFGGSQAVEDAMADAAEEIIQAMPVDRLHDLEAPDLVCLVNRASQGQVQAVIPSGWRPAVSGSIHVWAGPPQAFTSRPILRTNPWGNNVGAWPSRPPWIACWRRRRPMPDPISLSVSTADLAKALAPEDAAALESGALDKGQVWYEFITREDDRVRPSHRALHGTVWRSGDPGHPVVPVPPPGWPPGV